MIRKQKSKKLNLELIIFLSAVLLLVIGWVVWKLWPSKVTSSVETKKPADKVCLSNNFLTNQCNEKDAQYFVYGVMIDNHSAALPTSGVSQASLVFEQIIEMPITRLLAVFTSNTDAAKIGPVRSARPFYVDYATQFNMPYLHVGGSDAALNMLKNFAYDVNEFYLSKYFYRSILRSEPHNTYTSSTSVLKLARDKNWLPDLAVAKEPFFLFAPELKIEERGESQEIVLPFSDKEYEVVWRFDREKNQYERFQGGVAYKDASNGEQIAAKNIVVIFTDMSVIDSYGRLKVKTVGSGDAVIINNGLIRQATWNRESDGLFKFKYLSGNSAAFVTGSTWIEILPREKKDKVILSF